MGKKERLDKYLTDLGYFETKSKAAAAILAGSVKINDERITKAGFQINTEKEFEIEVKSMPYVSRGAFKLKKAYEAFDFEIKDRICFDAGASTGGFTDFLLQQGAKKVYAVDVGYGQIAWKLREDTRVEVIERTNIRTCAPEEIYKTLPSPLAGEGGRSSDEGEPFADLLVMDVSFISITKVLENLKTLLNPGEKGGHELICLIKPQFEAGKELIEKGGVVKDKKVHKDVIENVLEHAKTLGYETINLTYSSIKGPSGNIEYLVHLSTSDKNKKEFEIEKVVEDAHLNL